MQYVFNMTLWDKYLKATVLNCGSPEENIEVETCLRDYTNGTVTVLVHCYNSHSNTYDLEWEIPGESITKATEEMKKNIEEQSWENFVKQAKKKRG